MTMKNKPFVLTMTPFTKKDTMTMLDFNSLSKLQPQQAEERYMKCLEVGERYWTTFRSIPAGRILLRHVIDEAPLRHAKLLFECGFAGGSLFSPVMGETPLEYELAKFACNALWLQYLRTCEGEIVLDGEAYPKTPSTLLNQAKDIFAEGFRAGQFDARWRKTVRLLS